MIIFIFFYFVKNLTSFFFLFKIYLFVFCFFSRKLMILFDLVLLVLLVVIAVFITWWITPIILVIINRLLIFSVDPFLILILCMFGGAVWNLLLWYFDEKIHNRLNKKLKIKKEHNMLNKKKWTMRIVSHKLREKLQMIQNKYIVFFWVMCASFTFIPDFFIADFSQKKMKMPVYVFAMFIGKIVVYAPLIWWSIGFMEIFKLYL